MDLDLQILFQMYYADVPPAQLSLDYRLYSFVRQIAATISCNSVLKYYCKDSLYSNFRIHIGNSNRSDSISNSSRGITVPRLEKNCTIYNLPHFNIVYQGHIYSFFPLHWISVTFQAIRSLCTKCTICNCFPVNFRFLSFGHIM
jgi:hypothetical protein